MQYISYFSRTHTSFFKKTNLARDILIYRAVFCPAVRRKTISSLHSFVSSARRNPAAAVERDSAETQTRGNKRYLLLLWTQGAAAAGGENGN